MKLDAVQVRGEFLEEILHALLAADDVVCEAHGATGSTELRELHDKLAGLIGRVDETAHPFTEALPATATCGECERPLREVGVKAVRRLDVEEIYRFTDDGAVDTMETDSSCGELEYHCGGCGQELNPFDDVEAYEAIEAMSL